jgi:hypothetical protein
LTSSFSPWRCRFRGEGRMRRPESRIRDCSRRAGHCYSVKAAQKRSAGFQTCCIADFQIGSACDVVRRAGLETGDTAGSEACATMLRFFYPFTEWQCPAGILASAMP